MTTRASLADVARITEHGYRVDRHGDGWLLLDPDGGNLMIGDHGGVAPTKWEAVAEALRRIEEDERHARDLSEAREGIAALEARYAALDDQFDRALDDDAVSKAEMIRIKNEWNQAWTEYADACRDIGVCVRPGCSNSVVVANQRICPTCREEK